MVVGRDITHPFYFSIYATLISLKGGFDFIRVIFQHKWPSRLRPKRLKPSRLRPSRLRPSRFKEAAVKLWVNSSNFLGKI